MEKKSNIIGQATLTNEIGRILDIFIASDGNIRPHFILTGESGSGKSFTIKTLCQKKEIGMLEINAAQLTKEGTAGNSLSKALSPIMNMKSKKIVVFVDEFDKLFISTNSNSSFANDITTGVQNEFLKVLESGTTAVYGDYGKYLDADVSKVLFVFAGAFNNEDKITLDKLRNFGVKTEFLGRVGLVYNTKRLTLEDLYAILEYSELLEMYMKIFSDVRREEVVGKIKDFLKKNYKNNPIGARIINTLINQYFIKGGEIGLDDVEEVTFQEKLQLN
ncbi:MAG: AAA family ATPase [Lachnospiraceae bacterium]|nr:AAA family ATPase [Lachnospiraceae bacterium]